jgi:SAM-dependent methyltransferase
MATQNSSMPVVPAYFDRFNPELLRLIPPDAGTVLEIGCGAGALAQVYRRINPGVKWVGWDINREAIEVANSEGRCTAAVVRDIDSRDLPGPDGDPKIDVMIFGDVLEHLRDPWRALEGTCRYLKPGGLVLASIPNVGHWTVIAGLLRGEWDYQDEGLLDRTHLRFFTLKSIRELFKGAGLEMFEVRGRKIGNEGYPEFVRMNGPCPNDALVYQWIVRALKPTGEVIAHGGIGIGDDGKAHVWTKDEPVNPVQKLHIHAITAEACCARQRIHEPFAALATIPGMRCTTGSMIPSESQVVILQRPRFPTVNVPAVTMAHPGKLLIIEIDDDPAVMEGMRTGDLATVHAVQCSTEAIAEIVHEFNPNVIVFPNQIAELPPWEEKERPEPVKDTIHIFFGAQNREADWAPIMPALNRIAQERDNLWFAVIHDKAFYNALETGNKHFRPWCDYETYRSALRWCDIALLPLEDTRFNRCKSDLKFLECAAEGTAVLASQKMYWDVISNPVAQGLNCGYPMKGVLYGNAKCFEHNLKLLISKPTARRAHAELAYAYVRDNRMLGQHYRRQHEWYQSLLTHKSELDRQLAERVPALAEALPASQ